MQSTKSLDCGPVDRNDEPARALDTVDDQRHQHRLLANQQAGEMLEWQRLFGQSWREPTKLG